MHKHFGRQLQDMDRLAELCITWNENMTKKENNSVMPRQAATRFFVNLFALQPARSLQRAGFTNEKGFTLFTPLVGTAVMIMSVLIVVSMLQNDIRFSHTLSNSYAAQSHLVSAKIIRANVLAAARMSLEKTTAKYLGAGIHEMTETNARGHGGIAAAAKENIKSELASTLLSNLFTDIRNSLDDLPDLAGGSVEYGTVAPPVPPADSIDVAFNAGGEITETLHANKFTNAEAYSVKFTDDLGNTIQVSIIPEGGTMTLEGDAIGTYIDKTAEAYKKFENMDTPPAEITGLLNPFCTSHSLLEVYYLDNHDYHFLLATWKLNLNVGQQIFFTIVFGDDSAVSTKTGAAHCPCIGSHLSCILPPRIP